MEVLSKMNDDMLGLKGFFYFDLFTSFEVDRVDRVLESCRARMGVTGLRSFWENFNVLSVSLFYR